ncbi:MAG: catalase family protein [Halioglobus sp.]
MNKFTIFLIAVFSLVLASCSRSPSGLKLGEEQLGEDEARHAKEMVDAIKSVSLNRHPSGKILRFNQSKTLGCFKAQFQILGDLEPNLRQGLFRQPATYPAQLRIANATKADDTEKDFRGMSIKIHGVEGPALWGLAGQQDFILNSYPRLFAANPEDFLSFIDAGKDGQLWKYFVNPSHFYSLGVVLKGREKIDNPFGIRYWSTTPYRFGDDSSNAVKYSTRPCSSVTFDSKIQRDENFLTEVMREQLNSGDACFDFMVQFQTDPDLMPIEDASVEWDESLSPFEKVAEIHIDNTPAAHMTESCERMTFNPWQSLAAHRPLGGVNRARKLIYAEIGEFRSSRNRERQAN